MQWDGSAHRHQSNVRPCQTRALTYGPLACCPPTGLSRLTAAYLGVSGGLC